MPWLGESRKSVHFSGSLIQIKMSLGGHLGNSTTELKRYLTGVKAFGAARESLLSHCAKAKAFTSYEKKMTKSIELRGTEEDSFMDTNGFQSALLTLTCYITC